MDIKVNRLSNKEEEVEVTLDYSDIKPEIIEVYKKERKNISIPGFRKGKIPIPILKKMYGDAIDYKAAEEISQKKFFEYVREKNVKLIGTPKLTDLNLEENVKLTFKIEYEIHPELELTGYKNLEIDKPVFTIKEEDIDKEYDNALKSKAVYQDADSVEDENFVINANLQKVDEKGVVLLGSKTENAKIDLSDKKTNPQIVENAKDKKVGESFNFTYVDEHYHGKELHREEINYSVEIISIQKIVYPEVTEELIKELSGGKAKSEEEFKDIIRDQYMKYFDEQSENIYTNTLINKIIEANKIEPSSAHVEGILERLVESEKETAKRNKYPFNEDSAKQYLKQRAVSTAKIQIIVDNVARIENITVNDDDLRKVAEEEAGRMGIEAEKLLEYYKQTSRDDYFLEDKVMKFLKENNSPVEIDADEHLKKTKESGNKTEAEGVDNEK